MIDIEGMPAKRLGSGNARCGEAARSSFLLIALPGNLSFLTLSFSPESSGWTQRICGYGTFENPKNEKSYSNITCQQRTPRMQTAES